MGHDLPLKRLPLRALFCAFSARELDVAKALEHVRLLVGQIAELKIELDVQCQR
jgi:hypothetical protein